MTKQSPIIKVPALHGQPMIPCITNEMKAECIGRFLWLEEASYYDEHGNLIEYEAERVVPWDLCKEIYIRMAKVAAGINVPSLPGH